MEVAGVPRTYVVYTPQELPPESPLLIALHGLLMNGELMRKWTGYEFDTLAEKSGFAVVYPDGIKRTWNGCLAHPFPFKRKTDDVSFIRAIVANLREEFRIDLKRVYIVGYSDGGDLAFRLLADAPDLVAAIAVAGMAYPEASSCKSVSPAKPVMMVSGVADPLVPYEGGQIGLFGWNAPRVLSAKRSAEVFAVRNGISKEAVTVRAVRAEAGSLVMEYDWSEAGKMPVILYAVEDGGHVVPQRRFRFPRIFGRTLSDFDMPAKTIEFFGL